MLKSDNLISRAAAIEAVHNEFDGCLVWDESGEATANEVERIIASLPSEAPDGPDNLVKDSQGLAKDLVNDCISRKAAIEKLISNLTYMHTFGADRSIDLIEELPSAQPEQRYTEEELRVFAHGISLSLLSKRSAQHWQYDEDTATEIKFLERLYEKVGADMKGGQE